MKWIDINTEPTKSSTVAKYLVSDGVSHRVCFFMKDEGFICSVTDKIIHWGTKYFVIK